MAEPKTATVIGEGGDILDIPAADLQNALRQGYAPATPEQLKEYDLQQKYGEGLGNELRAGAEGVARGVIPGADLIQVGLGVDPEGLKERQARSSAAATVGEVLGTVGSVASGVGPAAWIAKGGQAVTKGVLKAAGTSTVSSLAARAAAKAGATAAGSALEGMIFEAGHLVNEAALGDPKQVAEKAIAQLGLAALMGGALGGVLGTAEELIPAGITAAKDATGKLARGARDKFEELYPKGLASVGGTDEAVTTELLRRRGASAVDYDQMLKDTVESLDEQHGAIKKAIKEAPRSKESELLTSTANDQAAIGEFAKIRGEIKTLTKQMVDEPDLFPARFRRKLQLIDEGIERDIGKMGKASDVFARADQLKKQLYDLAPSAKKVEGADELAHNAINDLRKRVQGTLEDPAIFAAAGDRQAIYNAKFSEYKSAQDDFFERFGVDTRGPNGKKVKRINPKKIISFLKQEDEATGAVNADVFDRYQQASKALIDELETTSRNVPGTSFDRKAIDSVFNKSGAALQAAREEQAFQRAVKGIGSNAVGDVSAEIAGGVLAGGGGLAAVKAFQFAKDPRRVAKALGALERLGQQTEKAIDLGAKALVRGGVRAGRVLTGPGAARMVDSKTFNERVDRVNALSNNPDLMHETISKASDPAYEHAPQTAGALSISQVLAIQALTAALPRGKKKTLLGPAWKPSKAEMSGFNRIWNAIDKPTSILDMAAHGTLTSAEVGAVKSAYPALFQQMQTAVLDQIADGKSVPYRSRPGIAMILETDVDGTFSPEFIARSQAHYQAGDQAEPTANKAESLTVAERSEV